ncbi:hypothetical protein JRO89_XS15G0139300 [Xanthoceras sorbifolium]|uniref:Uncharacterized protein n=1 Tax=Xanthoceras sorbifolium TaxID=99658 RepID=A0ABQ8H266_9ROSI|nr:hypothetical protein JRO89_XS15G0139300 [Xanthoceras sorbifolium]
MHPIPDEHLWPDVEFPTVLPPLKRRRPGKPKLQRRKGLNEPKKVPRSSSLKCSICHEVGHNSRTCKKKNDGQSGRNQSTTTSLALSTSTATNRRRMEVDSSSTSVPVDSNNQTIPPTSSTVTRVLWYSNTPAPSSNENQFGSLSQQDVSQSAPQPSQQCSARSFTGLAAAAFIGSVGLFEAACICSTKMSRLIVVTLHRRDN